MTQSAEQERAEFEKSWRERPIYMGGVHQKEVAYIWWTQAARRAPAVPETIEQRTKKLKGLQVLTGATAGVPEAIALARSRFIDAYGRSPLHDDLAYACLLIDAYGGAQAVPLPQGWKLVPVELLDRATESLGSFVSDHGWGQADMDTFDDLSALAAAPQPPEADHIPDAGKMVAAPVQMPEPTAVVLSKFGTTCMFSSTTMRKGEKIYTEHQLSTILAQQGIKTK